MPTITVSTTSRTFPPGTTAGQIFDTLFPARKPRPLAAALKGRARPLTWAPDADCTLEILDYTQDEGRRVYERSLRFLFCLAMRRVLPDVRVRMEHSAGYGLYIEATPPLNEEEIALVQAEMRALQAAELPFTQERWTREEAMAYFAQAGQADTVRLLGFRPYAFFDVYGCGGVYEYFYGDMLPSTAYLDTFALLPHAPGMVLQMPLPRSPQTVAPVQPRPKLMRAFAESAHWHDILGCRNVADLNDWVAGQKLREFVRVSEALQEKSIAAIADSIATRGTRAVFISGPSSSGKTTFTHRLAVQLRVNGLRPVMLSLDNYYRNLEDVPLDEAGLPDLECLDALDIALISEHLRALCRGETVMVPRFSFHENQRKPGGIPMQVGVDQPILIEGIHGLNPRLSAAVPREWVFRVYVSALTTLNLDDHNRIRTTDMRLLRRLVRDQQFRHAPFEETFAMWPSVRRGEERFIFPFQEEADVMFNSAVVYEAAVLKKYAYPTLTAIGDQSPYATAAQRLVKFLNYFQAADIEEELPPTAILREFIGGCSFYL